MDGTRIKHVVPSTEVSARPTRRRFTADFKLRILEETDRAAPGKIGAILRREGLYSSHLTSWRAARREGAFGALKKKRGRKAKPKPSALEKEVAKLRREKAKLELRLHQAELIIDIQKKVASALGIPLEEIDDNDESDS